MKPVSCISALLTSAAVLVPLWASDAGAVDIKVRQAVKVQPKVAAKLKVKVAPKLAAKPRLKLSPKVTAKPKIKIAPKITAKPRVKVSPKITALPKFKAAPVPAAKPSAPRFQPDIAKVPVPTPRTEHGAREAANAARAARDLANMNDIRTGATAKFDLTMPELGSNEIPSNQDRLGGMPPRKGSGFGFGDDLGSGATLPGGMDNTHNGKTPNNPYAVTPESVADGIGGIAGQQTVRLPLRREVRETHYDGSDGIRGVHIRFKYHDDGTVTETHNHNNVQWDTSMTRHIERDRDGHVTEDSGWVRVENGTASESASELRNPDYVGGNPDCFGIDCVIGSSEPKGLSTKKTDNNQILTAAPDHANGNGSESTPAISQEQLLSRYDSDRTSGTEPTPIDANGACQDC